MNGKDIVSRFLKAFAMQDVQGMADVLAGEQSFEMPFALPGLPDRVEGKRTVVEFLEQFLGKEHGPMFTGLDIHNIGFIPAAIRIYSSLNWMGGESSVALRLWALPSAGYGKDGGQGRNRTTDTRTFSHTRTYSRIVG